MIDGSFEFHSSRCTHDPSSMTLNAKPRQKFTPPQPTTTTIPEKQYICLASASQVCIHVCLASASQARQKLAVNIKHLLILTG